MLLKPNFSKSHDTNIITNNKNSDKLTKWSTYYQIFYLSLFLSEKMKICHQNETSTNEYIPRGDLTIKKIFSSCLDFLTRLKLYKILNHPIFMPPNNNNVTSNDKDCCMTKYILWCVSYGFRLKIVVGCLTHLSQLNSISLMMMMICVYVVCCLNWFESFWYLPELNKRRRNHIWFVIT